jgi:hypothetical protein
MRSFFLFSLLVAAASAFVAPANQAVGKCKFSVTLHVGKTMTGQFNCDDVINLVLCQAKRSLAGKSDIHITLSVEAIF